MVQLMSLPLTVSCFSKIQIGFTFLVPAHPGSPGQRAVKRVCVFIMNETQNMPKSIMGQTLSGGLVFFWASNAPSSYQNLPQPTPAKLHTDLYARECQMTRQTMKLTDETSGEQNMGT